MGASVAPGVSVLFRWASVSCGTRWKMLLLLCMRVASALSEVSECFTVNGRDYRGSAHLAGPEGTPCLYWNQTLLQRYNSRADPSGELGLGEHNHCRNPDCDVQPWCYVLENEEGVYWKYCDIPACHMPGYIGCFLDPGSPPVFSGTSGTSAKLTIQTCIQFCRNRGSQYAGLEAGYACLCGSEQDVATLQRVSSSQCDQVCFGRPSELCGGDGRLSVYAVWVGACRGNLSTSSGVLYSPDYPGEYGPSSECFWDIRPPDSIAIELQIQSFHVEDPNDVLEVRAGDSGNLLALIPGSQTPPPSPINFPTGHLLIIFRSDPEWGGAGYVLTYRGLKKERPPDASPDPRTPPTAERNPPTPYCWNSWLLLAALLALLALAMLLLLCRWAPCSWRAMVPETESSCYSHKERQRGDLTNANQSSMKSLL